jgi:hypothetical protein
LGGKEGGIQTVGFPEELKKVEKTAWKGLKKILAGARSTGFLVVRRGCQIADFLQLFHGHTSKTWEMK